MRGVSAAKEDVHNAIKNIDKGIFPQAFCKIIPDILGGDPEYCNIMHADGAGTKSSLAYMYWKETGDLSVWKGIAQDAIVMNTDDLLCVGAVDNILVSSTIGRNKMLIPGEVISAIINGTDDLLHEMREMGIGIYPTGGETADVGDLVRTIIVDSTVTCRMKRSDVINNANIRPGDVIVGYRFQKWRMSVVRFCCSVLTRMLWMWVLTVPTARNSSSAISWFDLPSTTRRITSVSRLESL